MFWNGLFHSDVDMPNTTLAHYKMMEMKISCYTLYIFYLSYNNWAAGSSGGDPRCLCLCSRFRSAQDKEVKIWYGWFPSLPSSLTLALGKHKHVYKVRNWRWESVGLNGVLLYLTSRFSVGNISNFHITLKQQDRVQTDTQTQSGSWPTPSGPVNLKTLHGTDSDRLL